MTSSWFLVIGHRALVGVSFASNSDPVYTDPDKFVHGNKNLHGSTLRSQGTGGTGPILEGQSVQVWDLKKAGQLFDRHGSTRRTDS